MFYSVCHVCALLLLSQTKAKEPKSEEVSITMQFHHCLIVKTYFGYQNGSQPQEIVYFIFCHSNISIIHISIISNKNQILKTIHSFIQIDNRPCVLSSSTNTSRTASDNIKYIYTICISMFAFNCHFCNPNKTSTNTIHLR